MGWKGIYQEDQEENQEDDTKEKLEDKIKGIISNGDKFNVEKIDMLSRKTKKKSRYTTATILSDMKKYNIGTGATRVEIIQTLIKRQYIIRDGKKFISTEIGRHLIDNVIEEIKSVELTSHLEEDLNKILKGEKKEKDVLENAINNLKENIENIKSSTIEEIKNTELAIGKCLECGGNIVVRKNFYGCSNYKEGCKFSIPGEFCGAKINEKQAAKILTKGKTDTLKFKGKKGEFKAKMKYNNNSKKFEVEFVNK